MCGIFGYYDQNKKEISASRLEKMAQSITHRGPDGLGLFSEQGVALGNQRLSILDLEHGWQPFISDDEQIVVVQNGEIFNHIEIADELLGTEFECKTHCDTEVILKLYERDGIDFIHQLNGMFAIAIYDKRSDKLFLIRDRVGEKPLHYSYSDNRLVFGSEIKSILESGVDKKICYDALDTYLTYNYVTPPYTLFENIKHVMPGQYLEISCNGITTESWWDLSSITPVEKSEEQWIAEFNSTLRDSVSIRLRSDVPFGAFLSGGVDSSTIVGLMSQMVNNPVKTYTIGFSDKKYDESPYALSAAERFATDHTVEVVESNMLGLWSDAIYHCDQPHGDVSFMPTYKVAELASRDVKVVLTGDGADELFAGYDKYKNFFGDERATSADVETFQFEYRDNISLFKDDVKHSLYLPETKDKINFNVSLNLLGALFEQSEKMGRINQALYIDTMLLLSGNNLVKPDRMGMAVSIENRAPFLDYRIIELAFSMPGELKLKNGETKSIYKKAVSELIGSELAYRKKQMFTVPVGEWLKHDLKGMVNDLLFTENSIVGNLLNMSFVEEMYFSHCSGKENYTREIRAIMALEIWLREFQPKL
ncbi:asparagine synthetase B [Vibrio nigripulchritudo]|uniref:asparagine synthase (glutamine-hydrolyzing) n=1 Tax=Vibrio nigripulchritudo TaxID=28173 RepID=UPI00190B9C89|nr:asparagine synthase (glutamine-hydrolyzing) [Vibrio nigripulchritudo]BCL71457.1 asparagine synthetase B [Vibrio nigripulchritudo]BDU32814.1 asparagine synthetase B [Vibrio nigripulchritudo]